MSFRVPQSQQRLEEESFWQVWHRRTRTRSAKKQAQGKVLHSVDFIRTNFMSFPDAPHSLFYKHHKHWPLLALMCLTKFLCKLARNRWMMFLLYTCICLIAKHGDCEMSFPFSRVFLYLTWSEERFSCVLFHCFPTALFSRLQYVTCFMKKNLKLLDVQDRCMSSIKFCRVAKKHFCFSAVRIQKSSVMLQLCGHLT